MLRSAFALAATAAAYVAAAQPSTKQPVGGPSSTFAIMPCVCIGNDWHPRILELWSQVQGRIKLNTGQMMTLVNCGGTAPGHGGTSSQDHFSNYTEWLRQGGRGIDTALTYTDPLNAKINAAMKWAAGPGGVPRSEIFLTTKVPCCPGTGFCKQPEYSGTIAADMAKNNELLGTQYTDLTLLHHPCDTVAHTIERYVELQEAMAAGHTKAIGVSNFNAELLAQLLADKRVKTVPAVSHSMLRM